jgi:hypothetical protein
MNKLHSKICESAQLCSVPTTMTDKNSSLFSLHNMALIPNNDDVYPKHLDSRSHTFDQCISFVILGEKLRYGVMVVRG